MLSIVRCDWFTQNYETAVLGASYMLYRVLVYY